MNPAGSRAEPHTGKERTFPVRFLLDRRWWMLLLLLWGALVGWSLYSTLRLTQHYHSEIALDGARKIFRIVSLTRLWNARHGGVYVPVTAETQPNPYLDVPNRDVTTDDGQRLTLINPAFMTRQLAELLAKESDVAFHITSSKPIRPANKPDQWEAVALQKLDAGANEFYEIVQADGKSRFRYMAPLFVKQPCLKCHYMQGYALGDLRGGISVSMSSTPLIGFDVAHARREMFQHGTVFSLVTVLFVVFLQKLRSKWLELHELEEHQERVIEERTRDLRHLATHDSLTGLNNRNELNRRMTAELERALRYSHRLSIFMIDIDHFKRINDTYSHQAGDKVLSGLAGVFEKELRRTDMVARFGGEEFVAVLPETECSVAETLAERLRERIARHAVRLNDDQEISVSVSIGVATYPEHAQSAESLLKAADRAMYAAKRLGRNRVSVAEPAARASAG